MWPVISKLWSVKSVGLDARFYNRVCLPLFALLVLIFSACPWLGWKNGVRDKRGLVAAVAVFLVAAGIFYALGYRLPLALVGAAGAVSCMGGIDVNRMQQLMAEMKQRPNDPGVLLELANTFMLGGLVLGWTESFATGYVSSDYEDVFAFLLLVLILIFRPAGLLGKQRAQKV